MNILYIYKVMPHHPTEFTSTFIWVVLLSQNAVLAEKQGAFPYYSFSNLVNLGKVYTKPDLVLDVLDGSCLNVKYTVKGTMYKKNAMRLAVFPSVVFDCMQHYVD